MADVVLVFSIVAGIIIAGFVGELFFKRTGIPTFVFLILIGIFLGPVLHVFTRDSLIPALGIFAELTLLMVLFYGGMDTKLNAVARGGGRAFVQVILYVLPSTMLIGVVCSALLHWNLFESFIFASMVGGETTAAVVIPLSRSLKLAEVTVAFLTLESAMNSIFSIVLFFTFTGIYTTGTANLSLSLSTIAANFSVGIVLGAIMSVAWIYVLYRYQRQKYTYVLTLGLIFITYALSSRLGGSGELSVLIFGIILGNYQLVNYLTKGHVNMDALQRQLGIFQEEISFLMETFFFVFLGLTFEINPGDLLTNFLVGLLLLGMLMLFRVLASEISTGGSELMKDRRIIVTMCAQGLVPATLAILALNDGIPLGNSFLNLVTYVIILTNLVTAGGAIWKMRMQKYSFRDFMAGLNDEYGTDAPKQ